MRMICEPGDFGLHIWGLGNLHDMLLLPNMYQYLKAVLVVIK